MTKLIERIIKEKTSKGFTEGIITAIEKMHLFNYYTLPTCCYKVF